MAAKDNSQFTPLLCATEHRHLDIVRLLLDHHANVQGVEYRVGNAMHLAAAEGDVPMAALLAERGWP